MIKVILILISSIGLGVMWLFATSTQVNGQSNNKEAFIIKSIFYWIAIICAGLIGYSIGKI